MYQSTVRQNLSAGLVSNVLFADDTAAPIMDQLDVNFHVVQFNGSFVHENIYRQDAGPMVDEAWEALGVGCEDIEQST